MALDEAKPGEFSGRRPTGWKGWEKRSGEEGAFFFVFLGVLLFVYVFLGGFAFLRLVFGKFLNMFFLLVSRCFLRTFFSVEGLSFLKVL